MRRMFIDVTESMLGYSSARAGDVSEEATFRSSSPFATIRRQSADPVQPLRRNAGCRFILPICFLCDLDTIDCCPSLMLFIVTIYYYL